MRAKSGFVMKFLTAIVLLNPIPFIFGENCADKIRTEEREVRGESLTGLIERGSSVRVLFGYYGCHEIEKEDVVAYNYAGNPNPVIKIVKAVPGDTFKLKKAPGGWNLLVNGKVLKNSGKEPYLFDERGRRMLSLYESDYRGVVPPQAYLILGNLARGSLDSSRFGLVHQSDILGKVVPAKPKIVKSPAR